MDLRCVEHRFESSTQANRSVYANQPQTSVYALFCVHVYVRWCDGFFVAGRTGWLGSGCQTANKSPLYTMQRSDPFRLIFEIPSYTRNDGIYLPSNSPDSFSCAAPSPFSPVHVYHTNWISFLRPSNPRRTQLNDWTYQQQTIPHPILLMPTICVIDILHRLSPRTSSESLYDRSGLLLLFMLLFDARLLYICRSFKLKPYQSNRKMIRNLYASHDSDRCVNRITNWVYQQPNYICIYSLAICTVYCLVNCVRKCSSRHHTVGKTDWHHRWCTVRE